MLSYDDLAIFVAVVERGSFIAAAENTNIPSSTLSRRLSRLESDLQIKLLERNSRRIHLTEKGKIFYQQCAPLIQQLKENTRTLSDSIDEAEGKIKITAPTYIGNTMLADIFIDFLSLHPKIDLEVVLSNGIEDIIDKEIDIAIRVGPLENSNFIALHLWDIEYVLCASPEYLKEHGTPETPDEIKDHHAIVLNTQPYPWRFQHQDKNIDLYIKPINRILLNDFQLAIRAIKNGTGIACLPGSIAQDMFNSGELVELLSEYQILNNRSAYVVYPDRKYLPKKSRLLIDYIKDNFSHPCPDE